MEFKKVNLVYFSATDVSKKYAQAMGKALETEVVEYDFTKPENRTDYYDFGFAMRVNDNDGYGRRGWCEYTSGIGRGKNTDLFGRLILSKPENMDN